MNNRKQVLDNLYELGEAFGRVLDSFADYKPIQKRTKSERQLRGALKHIAKYGKNTVLHTFKVQSNGGDTYEVKQLLNGKWETNAPLVPEMYIRAAQENPANATDISYGMGAIEAHRRLTGLAKQALKPEATEPKKYGLQFLLNNGKWKDSAYNRASEGFPYTKNKAEKLAKENTKNTMTYRVVPA